MLANNVVSTNRGPGRQCEPVAVEQKDDDVLCFDQSFISCNSSASLAAFVCTRYSKQNHSQDRSGARCRWRANLQLSALMPSILMGDLQLLSEMRCGCT